MPERSSPFYLVANQPTTRLHSQLDFGGHSLEAKHRGREVARMNPRDAKPRGVADVIRLFNAHGAPASPPSARRPSQGCTGQITTVQVERFNGNLPPIRAFDPV